MKWRLDPGQIEVIDDAVAEILKKKTPWERVQMASDAHRTARIILTSTIQSQHPDWSEEQVHKEVIRRLTRGAD
jgi:hypothetical protein